MQPVSLLFLVFAGVSTVAVVTASIFFSPKLSGSVPKLLGRIALQVTAHLAVVIMVTALVNAQMKFFPTWASLNPNNKTQGRTSHKGSAAADAVRAGTPKTAAQAAQPAQLPPLPNPGQRLQKYQIKGQQSGVAREVWVLLPADYNHADPKRVYPVIMALHGFPADPEHWTLHMQVQQKLDASVAAGKIAPSIVVIPSINRSQAVDSECVNGAAYGGENVETFLAVDLPNWTKRTVRASQERSAWNAFGYSVGGYCAMMLTLHHPDVFATAVSFSGYLTPDFSTSYKPFAPGTPGWKPYDLVDYVREAPVPPPVALWVQRDDIRAGADASGKSEVDRMLAAVKPPTSVTTFDQPGAGHLTVVWRDGQPQAFEWLAQASPAFSPKR